MVKKQKILIIVLASLFVLLTVLYFAVIAPIFNERTETPAAEPPQLLPGEGLDEDGSTILVFDYHPRSRIDKIEVHNSYGSYTCYREKPGSETFYIKDYEHAPFTVDTLSSLVVAAGYTGVTERVKEHCDNWEVYGLGADDEPAWYVLTAVDGTTHKVFIGDMVPSGGGYYCRYDGRDALYVIASNINATLLAPVQALISPKLGYLLDAQSYAMTDEVILLKNGESFVYIAYDKSVNSTEDTVISLYKMLYPGNYTVNDTRYEEMLLSFCDLSGASTIEVGKIDEPLYENEELMATYGFEDINQAPYELYYRYGDVESMVIFAPSGLDGYYFAYSYLFNLIALVEEDAVPYLKWSVKDYMYEQVYKAPINDVAKIEVSGIIKDAEKGDKQINESFTLLGEDSTISITPASTGKQLSVDEVRNFRQFYMVMLSMEIRGYVKSEGISDFAALEETATIKVTMDDGFVYEYKLYSYSDRRCYLTVNGEGEFYVNTKDVYKILCDATRAAHGLIVDRNLEYSDYVD